MNNPKSLSRLIFLSACSIAISVAAQAAPEVLKVEPPNWWAGHSINPVRVMIRGRNLGGARVQAMGSALRVVGAPRVNASGTYLFVDISIAPSAPPGARKLRLITGSGSVDAPFEITPPLARANRFRG
ncbi:MAG TPA: cyclomaltodextrinase N-terminal domain-containing protein, partial [Blastocatellia bacterium]|nr:cyclomaltodextrinase N-terminal domain-containing protein [Blastocatellia bacterium]